MEWETCNNGNCKCGLIWDVEKDIPVLSVLSKYDQEMFGYGLQPGSDEFRKIYKLAASAPKLLEGIFEILRVAEKQGVIYKTSPVIKKAKVIVDELRREDDNEDTKSN